MVYVRTYFTYTSNGCCVNAVGSNVWLHSSAQTIIYKSGHLFKKPLFEPKYFVIVLYLLHSTHNVGSYMRFRL